MAGLTVCSSGGLLITCIMVFSILPPISNAAAASLLSPNGNNTTGSLSRQHLQDVPSVASPPEQRRIGRGGGPGRPSVQPEGLRRELGEDSIPLATPLTLGTQQNPVRHGRRGFVQFIRLNFRRAGIEDILDKNQPSLAGVGESGRTGAGGGAGGVPRGSPPLKGGSKRGGGRRGGRRTHPRMLHFSRLEDFREVWCQQDTATIRVRARGCRSKEVVTTFCYGKCASIVVPRYDSGGRLLETFRSCGYCRAASWKLQSVQLYCPARSPPYKVKKVAMIESCACADVYKDQV